MPILDAAEAAKERKSDAQLQKEPLKRLTADQLKEGVQCKMPSSRNKDPWAT
jgi:hypothetical protein